MYMMASICMNQCMLIWNQYLGHISYGNTEVYTGICFYDFLCQKRLLDLNDVCDLFSVGILILRRP